MALQIAKITTGVDKLVELVKNKKRISVEEAAKLLSMPKVLIEEWADFLEEREVIGIEYKLASQFLVFKEMSRKDAMDRTKQFAGRKEGFVRKVDTVMQYLDQESEGLKLLQKRL